MSLTVVVQETALCALARSRSEDKESFASIRQALSALADQPRSPQAIAWGGSGSYRLRLPGIRGGCRRITGAKHLRYTHLTGYAGKI